MALPTTPANPAPPSPSHNHIPASNLGRKVDDARKGVLSILQDTGWPPKAAQDVQDFIQTMETGLDLQRIPTDDTQIQGELKIAIEQLLKELESVRGTLKEKSRKYDTKKKGLREEVAILLSGKKLGDCTDVLRNCRADVGRSLTSLSDHLGNLAINSEQRTSYEVQLDSEKNAGFIAEGSVSDDAGRLPGASLETPKDSVPSSTPSDQHVAAPAPAGTQQASVAAGKQKGSSLRENLNVANKALKLAEGLSGTLPVVGSYLGAVAKVGSTMVEIVQAMDDNDETAERLGSHVCRLSDVLERVSKQPRQQEESQTTNGIEALQRELRAVQFEVETLKSQPSLKKFWHSSDHSGRLKNLDERIRTALEEIQLLINLNTSVLVAELHNENTQNKHRHLLDRLGDGKYGARGNAIEDVTCLPGTRVEILGRIDNWIRGGTNSERVLWIRGMAGRGKSTIASTVAQRWQDRVCCATYFFRRGQNPPNSPLICSLARQLAGSVDPEIREAILSTVEKNENIINRLPDEQFTALFDNSLSPLKGKASPILIIVDALDECDSVDYAVNFVKLIDRHSSSLPDNLRFLLTSRPEAPLLRALEPRTWNAESLDTIADVDADVALFMHHAFSEVKKEHRIEGDWPAPDDMTRLVSLSQGLFQWARTVVKYIGDGYALNRLSEILESPKAWDGVDELYNQILSKALEGVKPNSGKRNLLLGVLGTLVAAPYPVSLEVVAFLHAEHESVKGKMPETVINTLRQEILAGLNSLLLIPASPVEPVRLMHTSIRDLLVDSERCGDRPYWVDLAKNHQRLASTCIRQMNQHLRENICNLSDLSKASSEIQDIVERDLSKGIRYCCRSWSLHLIEGKRWSESGEDGRDLHEADFELFSTDKVLFWLEVVSLVGATNEAVSMAKQVYDWLSQRSNAISKSSSIVALWSDVQRFLGAFSEPISFGPLHIYVSALPHCPLETELWRCYRRFAKVRTISGLQALTWPPNLWTRSTNRWVKSVAFSPDGGLIAFGSNDGTICLCDAQTWRQVGKPLRGHTGCVNSVCFSPDDKLLASGSNDQTIRLWDPETRKQFGEPLIGHTDCVTSVCFSPDGKLLASGSEDVTIRLWDPQTGKQFSEPMTSHTYSVYSVCFSPDSKLLASGSSDKTIRLWDPQTGKQFGEPLTGHTRSVNSVCFSPDSKLLASGSWDQTIRLWDPQTRKQFSEPLTGHPRSVNSVCFSPDSKLLASGSSDETIRLWDPQTGKQFGEPLTGHTRLVNSVCFSPDGKLLASGSKDKTIRLWDSQTGKQFSQLLTGHTDWVNSVCFSPDSKLLASGSSDETIRLWDPQAGKQFGEPLTGYTRSVSSIYFSLDGKLLASGSSDKTIRLWDPQTQRQVGKPLKGHHRSIHYNTKLFWDTLTLQKPGAQPDPPSHVASPTLRNQWVILSSSRFFWLPPQYWNLYRHIMILSRGKLAVAAGKSLYIFDVSSALKLDHRLVAYS